MMKLIMQQIPILNLRMEVSNYMGLFNNEKFCAQFNRLRKRNEPINTIYESWYGRSELLLSQILRTSILDIESAICSCVYFEAGFRDILNTQIKEATKNPFILGGKGTAINYYDRLPSLIDKSFKLSCNNVELWKETKDFYKNIRNPLFHGKELNENKPKNVKIALEFILRLFDWLDSWFDLNKLIQNVASLSKIPEFDRFIDQIVIPDYVPNDKPQSRSDLIEVPGVTDVSGISIQEYIHLTLKTVDDKYMNIKLSPKASMEMLGYLALAHKHTGWPIPERL